MFGLQLNGVHPPLAAAPFAGLFPLTMRGDSEQWNSSVWITRSHAWWHPLVEHHTHAAYTKKHTQGLEGPTVGTLSHSVHHLPLQLNSGQIEQRDGLNLTRLTDLYLLYRTDTFHSSMGWKQTAGCTYDLDKSGKCAVYDSSQDYSHSCFIKSALVACTSLLCYSLQSCSVLQWHLRSAAHNTTSGQA